MRIHNDIPPSTTATYQHQTMWYLLISLFQPTKQPRAKTNIPNRLCMYFTRENVLCVYKILKKCNILFSTLPCVCFGKDLHLFCCLWAFPLMRVLCFNSTNLAFPSRLGVLEENGILWEKKRRSNKKNNKENGIEQDSPVQLPFWEENIVGDGCGLWMDVELF